MKTWMYRKTTWVLAAVCAAVFIVYALSSAQGAPSDPTSTVQHFREKLLAYGNWAAIVSGTLMLLQSVIPPIPSNVITITNGLLFGPLWGALLSWSTMLLGACACFWLSKKIGRPFISRMVGPSLHNAEGFFKRYGVHAVFIIRIIPFMPFDAISYAAGILGVPFPRFLLASGIGLIPSVLIYTLVGPILLARHSWMLPVGICCTAIVGLTLVKLYQRAQSQQRQLSAQVNER